MPEYSYEQQLHDRATRGLPLSEMEQAQLNAWYAQQDAEEGALLRHAFASPVSPVVTQQQMDALFADMQTTLRHIQAVSAESEELRREIADLRRQLTQKRTQKAA